jgi:hypothetical protein
VADQHSVRRPAFDSADDLGDRQRADLCIDQSHLTTRVDQRTADRQQSQRRHAAIVAAARYGGVGRIEEENAHLHAGIAISASS